MLLHKNSIADNVLLTFRFLHLIIPYIIVRFFKIPHSSDLSSSYTTVPNI